MAFLAAWLQSNSTADLVGLATMVGTIVWTGVVMGEDIQTLRNSAGKREGKECQKVVFSFVRLHHVRTVVSLASLTYVCMGRLGML